MANSGLYGSVKKKAANVDWFLGPVDERAKSARKLYGSVDGKATVVGRFHVSKPHEPTFTYSAHVHTNNVELGVKSDVDVGDLTVAFEIYSDSGYTALVTKSPDQNLPENSTTLWSLEFADTFESGKTYYVRVIDTATNNVLTEGQFTVPSISDHAFDKWLKDGVEYNFDTPVDADFTLTGTWNNVYIVKFDLNGGSGGSDYSDQRIIDTKATLQLPAAPTLQDYLFVGWASSLDGHIWEQGEPVISAMTLKAVWKEDF